RGARRAHPDRRPRPRAERAAAGGTGMRLRRGLFVLAIVAALWGAPSSVSAAVNDLSSPQVSPTSGSVTTVFTFRVRYDGGFPAASVTVTVAGLTIPMILESGSLTAGTW